MSNVKESKQKNLHELLISRIKLSSKFIIPGSLIPSACLKIAYRRSFCLRVNFSSSSIISARNSLNFALECTYCNNSRHHYPIAVQIEENPYMPDNAQIHFEKLISLCKKNLCKKEYVENLSITLNELSDGIIDVDIKNLYK